MLEQVTLADFLERPHGRYVCSANAVEWCLGDGVLGYSVRGVLTAEDVDLFVRCIPVVTRLGDYASVADLRGYPGFASRQMERFFRAGLSYLSAARGRHRGCVTVLPLDFEARAAISGLYALAGQPLEPTTDDLASALRLLGARLDVLPCLESFTTVGLPGLSRREEEVARLAARGETDGLIARVLGIRESTVGSHLHQVYRKLGVHNRVDLANAVGSLVAPRPRARPRRTSGGRSRRGQTP